MAAGSLSYPVRTPAWELKYKGRDISGDISGMVLDITYKDGRRTPTVPWKHKKHRKAHIEADEVEVTLEDRDHRWQNRWFPTQGASIHLTIGYLGEELLSCGDFQVDEIETKGPPDTMHMKCIATGITPSIRTPRSAAYESKTLLQVAQAVAARHNLTLVGVPQDINVSWNRLTQHHETDLNFLRNLAIDHGYDFSIRGNQLVFYSLTRLEHTSPVSTIMRSTIKTFEFKSETHKVYKRATVSYLDPTTKQVVVANAEDKAAPGSDTLHTVHRVENEQQALLLANGTLHDANMIAITGRIETEGNVLLVAGINVGIQGFGKWDGTYHIDGSRHRLERSSGYDTEIEVRKL